MNVMNLFKSIFITAIIGMCFLTPQQALAQSDFVVIVNTKVPLESIDKSRIKRVYNGFVTQWDNGIKAKPCYTATPDGGFWTYMGTSKVNFDRFWTKRVFSGNGVSPVEHGSSADVIKYVNEISGAIGIIEKSAENQLGSNCKVLTLSN